MAQSAIIPNKPFLAYLQENEKPMDPDCFRVFVRVRPLNQRELSLVTAKKKSSIIKKQENMIFVFDPDIPVQEGDCRKEKAYVFDQIFDDNDNNLAVYSRGLLSINRNLLSGFNATVFAYGMTGAGKSYTMFGNLSSPEMNEREPGICIYLLQELFRLINSEEYEGKEFAIKLSYLEIYNEHIRDLLIMNSENLMILEDPVKGVVVPDLTEFSINTVQDLVESIQKGNARRTMASTGMNQFSSRSHAIIQLTVDQKNKQKDTVEEIMTAKLSLVDLAGSERAASTENKGIRMTEGAKINRSLLALGNCINILSDPHKSGSFVPYRDSKLTRLLKDSLGGNTKTIMIACLTSSFLCYEETVNTLKYASRARHIQRKVVKNVKEVEAHVSQYKEIIESLKSEVGMLRNQLKEKDLMQFGGGSEQKMGDGDYNSRFEELGKKIYSNLEENWEIKQSLNELKELKLQNEDSLKSCLNCLAQIIEDPSSCVKREKITEEIVSVNQIMENNEKVQREMESALEKNLAEKRTLQQELKKLNQNIISEQNSRTKDLENLALACKMLRLEKLDLFSQNLELRNTIFQMTEERKVKDQRIQELEELVLKLKSESSLKSSRRYENLENFQKKETNNGPSQIYFKIPDKYLNSNNNGNNVNKEVSSQNLNTSANNNAFPNNNNNLNNPHNLKTNLENTANLNSVQNIAVNSNPTKDLPHEKDKKDMKIVKQAKNNKKAAMEESRKPPVNIDDLKNYAEKIKNINFENVRLKKRKKKYGKKEEESNSKPTPVQGKQNEETKGSVNQLACEEFKPKASFNEVSSIVQERNNNPMQETSCENLDEFLRGLESNPDQGNNKEGPFSKKNLVHANNTERVKGITESFNELLFARNIVEVGNNNQSEKRERELSLERNNNNKYSIQTLDVAREKVRAFKLQLNSLLNNMGTGEITEKTKDDVRALIQDFAVNRYIISQNDKSLLMKLQELILDEKPDKQMRCFSATNHQKLSVNPHSNMNPNGKYNEEVIEENFEDYDFERDSNKGLKLRGKVNPGHFSKLNRNYAENVGKAAQQENASFFQKNRTKSKEKMYSDIHSRGSRHNSRSPMPLLETNNNANKQFFNVNLLQKGQSGYSSKPKRPHDLPKNPSSVADNQEKRHFFSNEVPYF